MEILDEILKNLDGKITFLFEEFNNELSAIPGSKLKEHEMIGELLFKIKYEIHQVRMQAIKDGGEESAKQKMVEEHKTNAVLKLQTLMSMINCHVLDIDKKL